MPDGLLGVDSRRAVGSMVAGVVAAVAMVIIFAATAAVTDTLAIRAAIGIALPVGALLALASLGHERRKPTRLAVIVGAAVGAAVTTSVLAIGEVFSGIS